MYEPVLPHLRQAEVRRASRGEPEARPVPGVGGLHKQYMGKKLCLNTI